MRKKKRTDPNIQLCKGRKEYKQEISYIEVIQEEILRVLRSFFKNCESWIGGSVSPMCGAGLWPTSVTRNQSLELDCLDRGRMLKIPDHAPNKQRGHGYGCQRCSGAATRGGGLRSEFLRGKVRDYLVYPPFNPCRGG